MFKRSKSASEPDLFTQTDSLLSGQAASLYSDPLAWHNQFYIHIKSQIDESVFEVLFDQRMGAPNASVSTLVSMMVLKEFFGWSDQQLFEHCRFHMLVRKALGMLNMDDPVPADSTYYLFRKRLYEYRRTHDQDLMDQTFRSLTSRQMRTFEINGRTLRMDSKLFSTNIAWYSRYELVHRTLRTFCKLVKAEDITGLGPSLADRLSVYTKEEPGKVVYTENKDQLTKRLVQMGELIHRLLQVYTGSKDEQSYILLQRVFDEQYTYTTQPEPRVQVRPAEQIAADSIQSPDDPDCSYRNKNGQPLKGYVTNVVETVDGGKLNLISAVRTEQAHVSDGHMLHPSLQASADVTGNPADVVHVDGAFHSPNNDQNWPDTDFVYGGIQGATPRYELELNDEDLVVTDTQTGQTHQGRPVKSHKQNSEKRWSIKTDTGKRVYFGQKAVRAALIRKKIKERPPQVRNIRNNVEATLYHLFCKMRGGKSRYRSLAKQSWMVVCRAITVNLHRIMSYLTEEDKKANQMVVPVGLKG